MAKYRLLTTFLSLVIALWSTTCWSQQETPPSDPFGGQAPGGQAADPFGPPESRGPIRSETSVLEEQSEKSPVDTPTAAGKTPAFIAEQWSERSEAILRTLSEPLSKAGLNFPETPLSEVVSFLRSEYDIEVQLDTQALDDLGLSPDDTVSVNLRNISLASALDLMLKQHDLTYIITDEILLITSEDEALARLSVRVYPVGDLLQPKEGQPRDSAPRIEELMEVLVSTVATDTWVEKGGSATIRSLQPGLLVVSQTEAVHKEVGHVLAALRRAREHQFALSHPPESQESMAPTRGYGGFGGGEFGGGGGYGGGRGARNPARP